MQVLCVERCLGLVGDPIQVVQGVVAHLLNISFSVRELQGPQLQSQSPQTSQRLFDRHL
jgi:hypothetical protein